MQDSPITPGATVRRTRGILVGAVGTVAEADPVFPNTWRVLFPIDARRPGGLVTSRQLHADELEVVA